MGFKEIKADSMSFNPFTMIEKEWMLLTAGDKDGFNTMTASWGSLGVFWGKNTATTYIRPTRYTKEFVDKNDIFSLAFFDEKYRDVLKLCGTVSGRDTDKVKDTNLTPIFSDGTTYFDEAKMVMVCKKLYHADVVSENFDSKEYDELIYPKKDYHTIYIGEIQKILVKE